MSSATYVRYDVLRTFRNRRFFLFSLVFPLVLFLVTAGANKDVTDFAGTGVPFTLYYMVGMASWGSMGAVMAGGARIAAERQIGWHRQLRLTPLKVSTYLSAKMISGYAMALVSIGLLFLAGTSYGVRLPAESWVRMTFLLLVGLVPFAVLGIAMGHLLTIDSMGPALGGLTALFALLGGAWGPIAGAGGTLGELVQLIPSYWLVQAGQSAYTGQWWPAKAWVVVIVWTVAMAALARRAYQRDTQRA